MASVKVRVDDLLKAAESLQERAARTGVTMPDLVQRWAEGVADIMREEVPKDSWETHDSITVTTFGKSGARIGPTNRDDAGVPVAQFIEYGRPGVQDPDPFLHRTAGRVMEAADFEDVL